MSSTNCYHCVYLSKRAGVGNYFIFKCNYWGIITQKVLPQSAVIRSIGKRCPFFKNKHQATEESEGNKYKNNFDDGFNIIA